MTDSRHSMAVLYAAVFLLALNGLFSKLIPLDATSITQLRSVLAAMTLFVFAIVRKKSWGLNNRREYAGVYFIGVILGLHWISFFHSMQISTVAIGMLSLFTYPMITVLLEPFFSRHKLQLDDMIAALVVLLGVFIMVRDDLHELNNEMVQGVLWGVLSAFLFALRNILQKYYYPGVPAERLMMHQVIAVAIMLLILVDYPAVKQLTADDFMTLILLGVVSTATAHTLLSYSLKHFPAKSIAMISCLQPFLATLFAWLLLNEKPRASVLLGGMIIVSVALYESLKKNR